MVWQVFNPSPQEAKAPVEYVSLKRETHAVLCGVFRGLFKSKMHAHVCHQEYALSVDTQLQQQSEPSKNEFKVFRKIQAIHYFTHPTCDRVLTSQDYGWEAWVGCSSPETVFSDRKLWPAPSFPQ